MAKIIFERGELNNYSKVSLPGLLYLEDGSYQLDLHELQHLQQRAKNLNLLIDSARSIMAEIGLDVLLDLIIKTVKNVMEADRATLFLIDKEKNELRSRIAIGSKQEIRIPIGVGIAGYVASTRETVNITNAYNDSRFNPENDKRTGYKTKSILCMPVYNSLGDILGVIQVLNKLTVEHFTEEDEHLLGAYASLAGISLANAQAYDELQKERDLLEIRVQERTKDLEEARKKSDELLLNILPNEIAEELKSKGSVTPTKYELVTVLFTDFKGFTLAAEKMSPENIVSELDNCFRYFDQVTMNFNLEKIKTIGDAFMCAGGVPKANVTNPVDAVLAALSIREFMRELAVQKTKEDKPFWEIRIGLHSGPLVAGVVGKKKFAYDVWGDTVNTASRMESSGEAGKINISQMTYELIKDFFECEYRGKIPAKNKGTIDMYFVHGIKKTLSKNKNSLTPNKKFITLYEKIFQSSFPNTFLL